MDAKRGFIFLNSITLESTQKLLMFIPHSTPWGLMIYQKWMHVFNLELIQGLRIHVVMNTKTTNITGFSTQKKTKTGLVPNLDHETKQIRTRIRHIQNKN